MKAARGCWVEREGSTKGNRRARKSERERDTSGGSFGLMALAFSARGFAANVSPSCTHTHTPGPLPHAGQVVPAYIHGLVLLLFG